MVLDSVQHEGSDRAKRHRVAAGRECVAHAAICFVRLVDQPWRPRDGPVQGGSAHDLLGGAEVACHVCKQPAKESEVQAFLRKQHCGGHQDEPLYFGSCHRTDCAGRTLLDQRMRAECLRRANAKRGEYGVMSRQRTGYLVNAVRVTAQHLQPWITPCDLLRRSYERRHLMTPSQCKVDELCSCFPVCAKNE